MDWATLTILAIVVADKLLSALRDRGIDLRAINDSTARIPKIEKQQLETLAALKDIRREIEEIKAAIAEAQRLTMDLHNWHNVKDGGEFVWHLKRHMFEAIKELTKAVERLARSHERLVMAMDVRWSLQNTIQPE